MTVQAIRLNYQRTLDVKNMPIDRIGLKWNKPPSGNVKVNIDASFYAKEGRESTRAIIDGYDVFLAALCSQIPCVTDAHIAESITMKHGLLIVNSLGFNYIQIESDSIEVINACVG